MLKNLPTNDSKPAAVLKQSVEIYIFFLKNKSDFMKDLQISEEIPVYQKKKKKIDNVKELTMLPRLRSLGTNILHANETLYWKLTIEISHLSSIPLLEKSKTTLDKVNVCVLRMDLSKAFESQFTISKIKQTTMQLLENLETTLLEVLYCDDKTLDYFGLFQNTRAKQKQVMIIHQFSDLPSMSLSKNSLNSRYT